ncbi:sulfite oxidase-like oxidoreductase [Sabulicella rubraurantiaca]|uniref:sulfite oxidase-like oxidoreductase n=1 Tax=Sabulicella rubraurantiaca TaxID=2811429 RepID=UPI001A95B9C5|nr:sulfite oxidase-like oxidoreductase [Sabulicella rubraurantiaca]
MAEEDGVRLEGEVREKLLRSKEQWAREGRLLTGTTGADRLPPGQRLVTDFPVLDLGVQPDVKPERWRLRLEGLVENRLALAWDAFMALPQRDFVNDIHCVTAWSRYDNTWRGVASRDLLELAKPKPEARFVVFHSYDGYTTNVSLDTFAAEDVLVAHSWAGKPLDRVHGGPARIVIPRYYFWKSAKWVTRIEFLAEDRPGFWEVRGYHNSADPWLEERYG